MSLLSSGRTPTRINRGALAVAVAPAKSFNLSFALLNEVGLIRPQAAATTAQRLSMTQRPRTAFCGAAVGAPTTFLARVAISIMVMCMEVMHATWS